MVLPTADEEIPSRRPALVKLRNSAACTNVLSEPSLSATTATTLGPERPSVRPRELGVGCWYKNRSIQPKRNLTSPTSIDPRSGSARADCRHQVDKLTVCAVTESHRNRGLRTLLGDFVLPYVHGRLNDLIRSETTSTAGRSGWPMASLMRACRPAFYGSVVPQEAGQHDACAYSRAGRRTCLQARARYHGLPHRDQRPHPGHGKPHCHLTVCARFEVRRIFFGPGSAQQAVSKLAATVDRNIRSVEPAGTVPLRHAPVIIDGDAEPKAALREDREMNSVRP
jgi:hypothetical protein